jgi:signal transduction histidine kinase
VGKIAAAADRITSHNLSEQLPVPARRDEIAHLTESLNGMIHRLQEALRVNERFVADASHELRTPLTVLRGELEQAALHPEVSRPLSKLLEEVDGLAQLVDNLLLLSRLDSKQSRREWTQIDLSQLTVQTVEQMALLAEDKHIRIHCDALVPAVVNGDGARLKQVIVNLLDNAIKYTPDRGLITLSVRHKKSDIALEVKDTGPGIPAEALPHLFERFFRVDPARSRELGGAGIGLSIVQAICHVHGGRVEVESVLGRGSVFRVLLPGTARPLPF